MPDQEKKGTVKEIVTSLLGKSESELAENGPANRLNEDVQTFLHQIVENEVLGHLELSDWMRMKDVEAYSFKSQAEEILIIYTYQNKNVMDALQLLLSDETHAMEEGLAFLQKNKGEQSCVVSGYSVGGAFAIYAAAKEGLSGVVFDAPGIGKILMSEQKHSLQVKNIIAYNSFLSAIGEHCEEVVYAKSENHEGYFLPNEQWEGKFSFDSEGQVLTGEMGEHYILLSKLNIISAELSRGLEEVMNAFADTLQLEERLKNNIGFMLLFIIEKLEEGQVKSTINEVKKRFNRAILEKYSSCRQEFQKMNELHVDVLEDFDGIQKKIMEVMENTMQQLGQTVEEFYKPVEAILSILALYSIQNTNLLDEIHASLEDFTETLENSLDEVGEKVTADIDKLAEAQMNSLMLSLEKNFRSMEM